MVEMKHLFMMKMFGGRGHMAPITTGHTGQDTGQVAVMAVMDTGPVAVIMEAVGADGEEVVLGDQVTVEDVHLEAEVEDNSVVRLEQEQELEEWEVVVEVQWEVDLVELVEEAVVVEEEEAEVAEVAAKKSQ